MLINYMALTKRFSNLINRKVDTGTLSVYKEMKEIEMFKSTGKIIYDPKRADMKRRTDWWCVVDVDREITRYLRWWVKKELWIDLCHPSWDAHISVIRGEKPKPNLMHLWKKYHGEKVEFTYDLNIRQSGDTTGDRPGHFWFVNVECPKLVDIRKELKMPYNWRLHLTFGRTY